MTEHVHQSASKAKASLAQEPPRSAAPADEAAALGELQAKRNRAYKRSTLERLDGLPAAVGAATSDSFDILRTFGAKVSRVIATANSVAELSQLSGSLNTLSNLQRNAIQLSNLDNKLAPPTKRPRDAAEPVRKPSGELADQPEHASAAPSTMKPAAVGRQPPAAGSGPVPRANTSQPKTVPKLKLAR